jgi:methionyl aminopeptidase
MIRIKTPQEIAAMKRGGEILSRVLSSLMAACVPGARTADLDLMARDLIQKSGGKPSFLHYRIHKDDPAYPAAVCISINREVVHGLAVPDREIKDGDLVGLDLGMWYEDLATDMAATVVAGKGSVEAERLNADTRESLERALAVVKEGAWIHEIGQTVEKFLAPKGYGIIRDLCGHGVGFSVHEEPQIPNYHERRMPPVKLKEGMCLAIEPMVALGDWRIRQLDDGWTMVTADGSLAAHWEVTVAVTKNGYELLTPWPNMPR